MSQTVPFRQNRPGDDFQERVNGFLLSQGLSDPKPPGYPKPPRVSSSGPESVLQSSLLLNISL